MRLMLNREELLKEQVEIYQKQYSEVEANIGGTTKNFQHSMPSMGYNLMEYLF